MAIDSALLTTLSAEQQESVRRLVGKGIKLPPQPVVLKELNGLLAKGVSDLRILSRTISHDPGVVAALFKVSCSPAYRHLQPLESVEHVLQAVGISQAHNIVQAVSLPAPCLPSITPRPLNPFGCIQGQSRNWRC